MTVLNMKPTTRFVIHNKLIFTKTIIIMCDFIHI